jgi:uncharacterized protein
MIRAQLYASSGLPAFFNAVHSGRIDEVKGFLASHVNIDAVDEENQTGLMTACILNLVEMVVLLLENGAAVDLQDSEGTTALIFAAQRGHVDIVVELLKYNANVRLANIHGWTALHFATQECHFNVASLLLTKDPECVDLPTGSYGGKGGYTALHLACQTKHPKFKLVGRLLVRAMLPFRVVVAFPIAFLTIENHWFHLILFFRFCMVQAGI